MLTAGSLGESPTQVLLACIVAHAEVAVNVVIVVDVVEPSQWEWARVEAGKGESHLAMSSSTELTLLMTNREFLGWESWRRHSVSGLLQVQGQS